MAGLRRVLTCLFACSMLLATAQSALAYSAELELQATVKASYTVSVACGSGGRICLADNTDAGDTFSVKLAEPTDIYIFSDAGFRIEQVLFNEEDITSRVGVDGLLTLPAMLKEGKLRVVFAGADTPSTDSSDGHNPGVNTGVSPETVPIILGCCAAVVLLFVGLTCKRGCRPCLSSKM